MNEVVSILCTAMLLLAGAGCNRSAPIMAPDASEPDDTDSETEGETGADTDGDGDTDADTDTDDDTDTDSESATDLPLCIYECVPPTSGCGNRGSYVHSEMTCPDPEDICCDYKKFEDSWECLICTEPYPTGAGRHDLRD